ncbi:serine hydrolase domain-containing protein [Aspergillus candidus]|uniref:Putative alkaline D-peptidase n=1 Tax=Aspergillus candidus TaxID=41067 RepID=A0A2I2FH08_ASPCN|nr:putative alkaline D-peptidase [Aspergillus candidus]PLB39916.1 putative alkaline D-peptidase [Aspergillus candidus]
MKIFSQGLIVLSLCLPGTLADIRGPVYPAPREISTNSSRVATNWAALTASLDKTLNQDEKSANATTKRLKNLTFSMGMFSLQDPDAETLQFHHTAPTTLNGSLGIKKVDADSIYRIASVTKLFTVLAGLVELDARDWERPLTEIFPALKDLTQKNQRAAQPLHQIQWDQVTAGALAAHMGIPRAGVPFHPDLLMGGKVDPATTGFPPLNLTEELARYPCMQKDISKCTPEEYVAGIATITPEFAPWTSPVYSNNGFILLGVVIAKLTGKSIDQVYQESIFKPLGLDSTFSSPPKDPKLIARSVIPGAAEAGFAIDGGISKSSGGIFSTLNDMRALGRGILNSTLLAPARTRKWMKPVTHTADLRYSLGQPWEIYRYVHPDSHVVTDIYTKLGDSGPYTAILVLLPDFDTGFTILGGSTDEPTKAVPWLTDLVIDAVVPALLEQAAGEARERFSGSYRSTVDGLNSSVTLSIPTSSEGAPGLAISSWISNGTDMVPIISELVGGKGVRLVPTIAQSGPPAQVAFRAYSLTDPSIGNGLPGQRLVSQMYDVNDWVGTLDTTTYGVEDVTLFVFDVETEHDGRADAVTLPAYRAKLARQK